MYITQLTFFSIFFFPPFWLPLSHSPFLSQQVCLSVSNYLIVLTLQFIYIFVFSYERNDTVFKLCTWYISLNIMASNLSVFLYFEIYMHCGMAKSNKLTNKYMKARVLKSLRPWFTSRSTNHCIRWSCFISLWD